MVAKFTSPPLQYVVYLFKKVFFLVITSDISGSEIQIHTNRIGVFITLLSYRCKNISEGKCRVYFPLMNKFL